MLPRATFHLGPCRARSHVAVQPYLAQAPGFHSPFLSISGAGFGSALGFRAVLHCPSQHSFSLRGVSRAPAPAALWGRALCEPCPKAPGTRGSALAQQSPLGKGRGGRNLPGSSPAMHQGGFGAAGTAALHLNGATSPDLGPFRFQTLGRCRTAQPLGLSRAGLRTGSAL